MTAVAYILAALPRKREGQPAPYAHIHERGVAELERYLRQGQRTSELRRFDTRVMALTIRAAIDAVAYQLATGPDLDLRVYARELARLFDHATRNEATTSTTSREII